MRVHSLKKDILFYIETEIQLESILPLLNYIRDNTELTYDVVVPRSSSGETSISNDIYDSCAQKIRDQNYKVIRSADRDRLTDRVVNTSYKLMLSAYIYDWQFNNLRVDYRVMFPYASYYFNKPSWTIDRFIRGDYRADALLSHAVGTKPITDLFTKTIIVPSLKLAGYKKKKRSKNNKPVLFFAPTYGDDDFLGGLIDRIDSIKEEYTFAMRSHQRSGYSQLYSDTMKRLLDCADKVYDVDSYSTVDALSEADILVSDNSAIIFDALSCGVPVALFSRDYKELKYRDVSSRQQDLVDDGYVLWTNRPDQFLGIVNNTLKTKVSSQEKIKEVLFPNDKVDDPVLEWMNALQPYLNGETLKDYKLVKKYWVEQLDKAASLDSEVEKLKAQVDDLSKRLYVEANPGIKSSITLLLRSIKRKFIHYTKLPGKWMAKAKYWARPYYRKLKIKFLNEPIVTIQFVFSEPFSINFGDEITRDILERLFKKRTVIHHDTNHTFDMLGVGSIINIFNEIVDYRLYVWGSGLIDEDVSGINDNFIFKACRGPQTRKKLPTKYHNIPMGDPGLLCNLIYKNKVKMTDKIGVIAHFRDEKSYFLNDVIKKHPEIFKIISVAQAPEDVADQIKSCRLILSSSLHGLIVSDSFSIPNMHLMLSDNLQSPNHLRGGEYKFRDYFSSVGRKYKNFNPRKDDLLDLVAYEKIIKDYKPIENLRHIQERLIKSFPYK